MRPLGSYGEGRDNNFAAVRCVAALLVLFTHSFAIATGDGRSQPLVARLGVSWGTLAVQIFFVTSGFLVTKSLVRNGRVGEFLKARALRIYPGLLVALTLTVGVAGIGFTSTSSADFLTSAEPWRYVVQNMLIPVAVIRYDIPGAFPNAGFFAGQVNGSLWTLPYELKLYVVLAVAWFVMARTTRKPASALALVAPAVAVAALVLHLATRGAGNTTAGAEFTAMFFAGASLYLHRDRIPLTTPLAAAALVVTLLATLERDAFGVIHLVTLPYLTLYFALVPHGRVRKFNRVGDFSYGIYIYAWPIQLVVMSTAPGIDPWSLAACAVAVTIPVAACSWWLIEKPALRLKGERGRREPSSAQSQVAASASLAATSAVPDPRP